MGGLRHVVRSRKVPRRGKRPRLAHASLGDNEATAAKGVGFPYNIFALNPTDPGATGIATIMVFSQGEMFEFAFGPGASFLIILAINGQTIDSVTISSATHIADIRQIRISGAANGTLVPEPGTLVLPGVATLGSRFPAVATAESEAPPLGRLRNTRLAGLSRCSVG